MIVNSSSSEDNLLNSDKIPTEKVDSFLKSLPKLRAKTILDRKLLKGIFERTSNKSLQNKQTESVKNDLGYD